jgi:hypothetical protein
MCRRAGLVKERGGVLLSMTTKRRLRSLSSANLTPQWASRWWFVAATASCIGPLAQKKRGRWMVERRIERREKMSGRSRGRRRGRRKRKREKRTS